MNVQSIVAFYCHASAIVDLTIVCLDHSTHTCSLVCQSNMSKCNSGSHKFGLQVRKACLLSLKPEPWTEPSRFTFNVQLEHRRMRDVANHTSAGLHVAVLYTGNPRDYFLLAYSVVYYCWFQQDLLTSNCTGSLVLHTWHSLANRWVHGLSQMFHLCGLACVYAAWLFMRPLVPCSVPGKSSKIAKTLEKAPHSWKCLHYVLALEYLLAENSKIHKRELKPHQIFRLWGL